ncbi:hypothetical protein ACFWZ5_45965, partial [Streptomyces sp. NPDC059003]
GVNLQVITDPAGRLLWVSPVLPGRAHHVRAARTHPIVTTCTRLRIPALAGSATWARAAPSPFPIAAGPATNSPSGNAR